MEINLKGMRFVRLVGILPEERITPQPIEIDLGIRLADDDGIVDYRELYAIVAEVMRADHTEYLEQIGERIARSALAHSARVRSARVAVRKPQVALGGPLDYAEVVVELDANA